MVGILQVSEFFEGKIILVCGGTGSIGSEIVSHLLRYKPKAIRVFSNSENELWDTKMKFKDSVKCNVSFPRVFRDSLDGWARTKGMTRSAFLKEAVNHYIKSIIKKGNHGKAHTQKT